MLLQADARSPDGEPLRWKLSADSEAVTWVPHDPTTFLVPFLPILWHTSVHIPASLNALKNLHAA